MPVVISMMHQPRAALCAIGSSEPSRALMGHFNNALPCSMSPYLDYVDILAKLISSLEQGATLAVSVADVRWSARSSGNDSLKRRYPNGDLPNSGLVQKAPTGPMSPLAGQLLPFPQLL